MVALAPQTKRKYISQRHMNYFNTWNGKKLSPKKQTPYQWIKDSISDLLRPTENDDLDSDSDDEEPLPSDPLDQAHPLDQPEISLKISREKAWKGFKLWKGSTSISPSVKHLGRNKSLVGDEEFVDYLIDQIELPVQFGFAPKRWAQALQTMLPKDKGMSKVTRLRFIQFFEVD